MRAPVWEARLPRASANNVSDWSSGQHASGSGVAGENPSASEGLARDPLDLAWTLVGSRLLSDAGEGRVELLITGVEAYRGLDDPASHCYRGRTARNAVMWGPPGRLYVYFVYGMHFCANVVGMSDGVPGAALLRAGAVLAGGELARQRRPRTRGARHHALGPAVLTGVLGIDRERNGVDLTDAESVVRLLPADDRPATAGRSGPRVGVSAAVDYPWRFWLADSKAVSTYRRGGRKTAARK